MKREELRKPGQFLVFNKGNNRKKLFYADADFLRFIKTALLFQLDSPIPNLHRTLSKVKLPTIKQPRNVLVKAYQLEEHSFELILEQESPNQISRYMQRLMTSYTKYYNQKYNHEGALFRGAYKISTIATYEVLKRSEAINSLESKYSSGYDYSVENRWAGYLDESIHIEP